MLFGLQCNDGGRGAFLQLKNSCSSCNSALMKESFQPNPKCFEAPRQGREYLFGHWMGCQEMSVHLIHCLGLNNFV